MKLKLLSLILIATAIAGLCSCADTKPPTPTQYPPVYRTYQDPNHGGPNNGGKHHVDGYLSNGKRDPNAPLGGF